MRKKNVFVMSVLLLVSSGLLIQKSVQADEEDIFERGGQSQRAKISQQIKTVQQEVTRAVEEEIKNKQEKEKQAAEKQAAEQKLAEKQAEQNKINQKTATQSAAPGGEAPAAPVTGQERGAVNREYGQQLSDPNLSPAERRAIIEEKKNYNRHNRGGY